MWIPTPETMMRTPETRRPMPETFVRAPWMRRVPDDFDMFSSLI